MNSNNAADYKDINLDGTPNDGSSRRSFVGKMGELDFGMMASSLGPSSKSAIAQFAERPKLSSIESIKVLREQTLDVPGGKEHFYEWLVSDGKGVTTKNAVHYSRVDNGATYTMTTDVQVDTFAAGADLKGKPEVSAKQHVTAFATKGQVTGSVRNDEFIFTTFHEDGSTTRDIRIVPVQLDTSRYDGKTFADVIAEVGKNYIRQ